MVTYDNPIACCARIAFGGPVEVQLNKVFWRRRPEGGAARGEGGGIGEGSCLGRRKGSPLPENEELRWRAS